MATKTSRVITNILVADEITEFTFQTRKGEEWENVRTESFCFSDVPEHIQTHLALYGIKGFLGDRCSQFRSHGEQAYLDSTVELWEWLKKGELGAPRKAAAGAIDRALVHLVAELKGQPLTWAEAQLKALPKETREALAEKYAERLAALRVELAGGAAGGLDDLL